MPSSTSLRESIAEQLEASGRGLPGALRYSEWYENGDPPVATPVEDLEQQISDLEGTVDEKDSVIEQLERDLEAATKRNAARDVLIAQVENYLAGDHPLYEAWRTYCAALDHKRKTGEREAQRYEA